MQDMKGKYATGRMGQMIEHLPSSLGSDPEPPKQNKTLKGKCVEILKKKLKFCKCTTL
jgi:hypothetical protein